VVAVEHTLIGDPARVANPVTNYNRYPGYQTITLLPAGSTPTKSASIVFGSLQQAESVQKELDGFKLKPNWAMAVVVVPADALA
jgi:hypothetical protein